MSTLQELFDRDPFEYSKQDLDTIVEKLRDMRKNFNLAAVPAKSPAKAKAPAKSILPDLDIEL